MGRSMGTKKYLSIVNKTEVLTNNPSVVTTLGGINIVSTTHWTMKDAQGRGPPPDPT